MKSEQSVEWLRKLWRAFVPAPVRRHVGILIRILLNSGKTLVTFRSRFKRLIRDRASVKGLEAYYRREREWQENGGSFQAPNNLPPGLLSDIDMAAIVGLAKEVPPGGTIIDVGSLAGRTTTLWCLYSQARRIVSVDPWEDQPWNESLRLAGKSIMESFLANVTDKRVEYIHGYSPDCARDWNDPVDLYWEDGDHSNPTCAKTIGFWSEHVRPGGIACGHDYHLPDVKAETDSLARKWGAKLNVMGSVWSIKRNRI